MRHIRRLRIDMTLQAQEAAFTPQQQLTIHSAVRTMASRAPLDLHCRMLEYKRSALFGMTVDASFPRCFSKHRLIVGAVCVVTVRTLHEPLGNAMMAWQRELSLNRGMTGETQSRLRLP
jgi:hypothetical protein